MRQSLLALLAILVLDTFVFAADKIRIVAKRGVKSALSSLSTIPQFSDSPFGCGVRLLFPYFLL